MTKSHIIIFSLLSLFFQLSCLGQSDKRSKNSIDSQSVFSTKIIDPVEPMAFDVQRETMYLALPDSLGGKNGKGISVLKLIINKEGKVQKFVILKLSIQKEGKEIINYWNDNSDSFDYKSYPLNVLKFYSFFEKYIGSLKIVPVPGIKPMQENEINIVVRF